MAEAVNFDKHAATKILEATSITLGRSKTGLSAPAPSIGGPSVFVEGELATALIGTSDGKNNPTKCTAKRRVPVPGDTSDPIKQQIDDNVIYDLVNRSDTLPDAAVGTYCIWVSIAGEWRIIYADC